MNKLQAKALIIFGAVIFFGSIGAIGYLLQMTRNVNAAADAPTELIVWYNAPLCNCDVNHSLAWNTIFGIGMGGVIVAATGAGRLRFLQRKGF